MSNERPTLTDKTGLGGVIAQKGFDYQLWDGLTRLPDWLLNPTFEAMIFEGLEDLEARFFAPQAPHHHLLERYQAKSGDLSPEDVRKIFRSFQAFDKYYPLSVCLHTLVTPRMPSTLRWLARDPDRVRKARPFYAPFPDVVHASDDKLKADLINEFGEEFGIFVAESVDISERSLPDRNHALSAFSVALNRAFPHLDVSQRKIEEVFEAISELARRSLGVALERKGLIDLIEEKIGKTLFHNSIFPIHIRSDRNEANENALEIDASAFSGGEKGFPEEEDWRERLIVPLEETARWLRSRSISRIALGGSYRLTTAFILGWAFRSATGFELEIPTRGRVWATDDRVRSDEIYPTWQISDIQALENESLIVSIGILRNPTLDLVKGRNISATTILKFFLPEPVTSARTAQVGVATIKSAISTAVARLQPRQIDLYFAGPASFAITLGHRWNAMPPTQLHEFLITERRYSPTARLST